MDLFLCLHYNGDRGGLYFIWHLYTLIEDPLFILLESITMYTPSNEVIVARMIETLGQMKDSESKLLSVASLTSLKHDLDVLFERANVPNKDEAELLRSFTIIDNLRQIAIFSQSEKTFHDNIDFIESVISETPNTLTRNALHIEPQGQRREPLTAVQVYGFAFTCLITAGALPDVNPHFKEHRLTKKDFDVLAKAADNLNYFIDNEKKVRFILFKATVVDISNNLLLARLKIDLVFSPNIVGTLAHQLLKQLVQPDGR